MKKEIDSIDNLINKTAVFGGFKKCSVRLIDNSRHDGNFPVCTTINSRALSEQSRALLAERISLLWNFGAKYSNEELKNLLAVQHTEHFR